MAARRVALSRAVSHALRHEPWLYEIEVDDEGWAPVGDLVEALRRDRRWRGLTATEVVEMMRSATKQRHEVLGDRIRALYGHSLPYRIAKTPGVPPDVLFHGTATEAVPTILSTGLQPMARQYVHLSADVATALAVGARKSEQVTVLVIDAAAARAGDVVFLRGNEQVWLAEHVPAPYLRVKESSDVARGERSW